KPYLIECMTFRMRGHEEASGTKYIPQDLFRLWEQKDPVKNYERWLIEEGVLKEIQIADIRNEFKDKIESELAAGFNTRPVVADTESELEEVFTQHPATSLHLTSQPPPATRELRF